MSSCSVVVIGFRDIQLSVRENDGTVNLVVIVRGGKLGTPVTVLVYTADGTANGKYQCYHFQVTELIMVILLLQRLLTTLPSLTGQ